MDKKHTIELLDSLRGDEHIRKHLLSLLTDILDLRENLFHPLVFINGNPIIGKRVHIGFFSEVNAKGSEIIIGDDCDIASFVSINVADSHKKCIGLEENIERKSIILENNVFVGSHSFIGGLTHIGHNSVVAAGTILINGGNIPPYSLVFGNPASIKNGYYENFFDNNEVKDKD
jgi:acetyltransferase-like isoleucine patch superfamily enzyme